MTDKKPEYDAVKEREKAGQRLAIVILIMLMLLIPLMASM